MGEYRGIMNLCRVLPNGPDAKLLVDEAIDMGASIGNLRNDIVRSALHFAQNFNAIFLFVINSYQVLCDEELNTVKLCHMCCIMNFVFGRQVENFEPLCLSVNKATKVLPTFPSHIVYLSRCKEAAEDVPASPKGASPFQSAAGQVQASAASARRLGLHYLQRYFYLITFFAYLDGEPTRKRSFAKWMTERRELKHLLSTLSLEPVI